MTVLILQHAENDLAVGRDFYAKKGEAVGEYFLDSLSADIESLSVYASIHRRVGRYFRALSHIFPYAIYYTTEDDLVLVWAVLDCRRSPSWIRKQLRSRN